MNSQLFFILNLLFGSILLFWFLSGRKNGSAPPTRLKMRDPSTKESKTANVVKKDTPTADLFFAKSPAASREKRLNVFFMYNGHSWDAYEVLGLPAGTNLNLVTERFQQIIKDADRGKVEFYELAIHAIVKSSGG